MVRGTCSSRRPVALDIVSPDMTFLIHSSAAVFCLLVAESRVKHRVTRGEYRVRPSACLQSWCAVENRHLEGISRASRGYLEGARFLSQARIHHNSRAGGAYLLWLLGGPGGGSGGAPGCRRCRMCTALGCSGPKSVAALRSFVAASWMGVAPSAISKSTADTECCGEKSFAACQCGARVEAGVQGCGGAESRSLEADGAGRG